MPRPIVGWIQVALAGVVLSVVTPLIANFCSGGVPRSHTLERLLGFAPLHNLIPFLIVAALDGLRRLLITPDQRRPYEIAMFVSYFVAAMLTFLMHFQLAGAIRTDALAGLGYFFGPPMIGGIAFGAYVVAFVVATWFCSGGYSPDLEPRCAGCQYSLREATSTRCPECGRPIPAREADRRQDAGDPAE